MCGIIQSFRGVTLLCVCSLYLIIRIAKVFEYLFVVVNDYVTCKFTFSITFVYYTCYVTLYNSVTRENIHNIYLLQINDCVIWKFTFFCYISLLFIIA